MNTGSRVLPVHRARAWSSAVFTPIAVTGRNGTILLILQVISLRLSLFCLDCSKYKCIALGFFSEEIYTCFWSVYTWRRILLDAEGVSYVAGLLKGLECFWAKKKKNLANIQYLSNGKNYQHNWRTDPTCTTQLYSNFCKYKKKKKEIFPAVEFWTNCRGKKRKGFTGQYIPLYPICSKWAEKAKKEQSSGSPNTQVFAASRKNVQRSKGKLFPSFRLKAHWN